MEQKDIEKPKMSGGKPSYDELVECIKSLISNFDWAKDIDSIQQSAIDYAKTLLRKIDK